MSTPKNRDTLDRPSARPDTCRNPFGPTQRLPEADYSEHNLTKLWIGRVSFVEDFTLEHSICGLHMTSIEITSAF